MGSEIYLLKQLRKFLIYINKPFGKYATIQLLGFLIWLFILIALISIIGIIFIAKPDWEVNNLSDGLNNLFVIYKFPLYLLAASIAVITLRITLVRVTQTEQQLEIMASSYKPIILLEHENMIFESKNEGLQQKFKFISKTNSKSPNIKIINVGLEVAIEISYYFRFDYKEIFEFLRRKDS